MDPYLFLCVLAIAFSVHNVYAQMGMGHQNQGNMRRKFPGRQAGMGGGMGGGMGTGNNNQQGMNLGGSPADMGMPGNGMGGQGHGQGQGHGNGGQGQGNGMNNMGGGGGGGGLMGGMLGGGMPMDAMMGGMQANMMAMGAMNSEIPPHMIMSGTFNPKNFAQYRSCEKTPSNLNTICDPSSPNPCPQGAMISKSTPFAMGMGMAMGGMGGMGMGGMNRRMNRRQNGLGGGNPLICSRMTEHGLARCCAKNMMTARMLDKWFK